MSDTPRTKRGHGLDIVNGGPYGPGQLVRLFTETTRSKLAGCWVACMADSFECGSIDCLSDLIRPLVVVAERLHGCKFPDAAVRVSSSMRGNPMPQPTTPTPTPAKPPKGRSKYVCKEEYIHAGTGEPPEQLKTQKQTKDNPVSVAMLALKPGEWFKIDPAPQRINGVSMRCTRYSKTRGVTGLRCYRTHGGAVIVIRDHVEQTKATKKAD